MRQSEKPKNFIFGSIRSGASLRQLLYSATLGNARAFKLDSSSGSVEKGKMANLLLLNADPYKSVQAYDQIEFVILEGRSQSKTSTDNINNLHEMM